MSNYQGRLEDSQANKLLVTPHSMANIEDSDTASQIYTVGNMLVFNNRLCKVTAAIAQGDTLEVGTNIAYKGINDIGQQLCASDGKEFYFDVKDGEYGYYPSASKVPAEFVPFGGTPQIREFADVELNCHGTSSNPQTLTSTINCADLKWIILSYVSHNPGSAASRYTLLGDSTELYTTTSTISNYGMYYDVSSYSILTFSIKSYYMGSLNIKGIRGL